MGRSSRTQANDNRARIVDAASRLFRERGIEAVTIADVMKAAGMTQGGFYGHFANKDALAAEACTLSFSKVVESWTRVFLEEEQNGRNGTSRLVAAYIEQARAKNCPMIAFAADVAQRDGANPLRRAYETGVKRLFDTFAEFSSGPDQDQSLDHIRMLFAAMVGSNMLTRAISSTIWMDNFKKSIVNNV